MTKYCAVLRWSWLAHSCLMAFLTLWPRFSLGESSTAYLWGVRVGCERDPLMEDAALRRIRSVGRTIVALNVPATAEMHSCTGKACGELVRRALGCGELRGPLIGAELDEVQTGRGVVTRIRAWRYDLGTPESLGVATEHTICAGDRCGVMQIQEAAAKSLNRLLDREPGFSPQPTAPSPVAFPSLECVRGPDGGPMPIYCEQPMARTCGSEDIAQEPSGRTPLALPGEARHRPSLRPRGWELLPIFGAVMGLATTVGIGVANQYITAPANGNEARFVLTPTFWVSAGLTTILGISSAAVVGERYHREMRQTTDTVTPDTCILLLDGARSGRTP